jgi:hypothetical protein
MHRRSFLEDWSMTEEERRLRRDIDASREATVDAAERADQSAAMAAEDSAFLSSQVTALHMDVARLTAMVTVLAEALAQKGALDMTWATARLRQELAKIDPPPPEPPPPVEPPPPEPGDVVTYRGDAQVAAPSPPRVDCDRCHVSVVQERTYVTEYGTICESCFQR